MGISFFAVGGSINPNGDDQDISPYATFHLLGMREENKGAAGAAGGNPAHFRTMQPGQQPGQQPQMQPPMSGSPMHAAQTMNVS